MPGFTNEGFTFESGFDDVAKQVKTAAKRAEERVGLGIAQVFSGVEQGLQDVIREHPVWDSAIADRTRFEGTDVVIDDERAMDLETGRDPSRSPSPVITTYLQQNTADIEDRLSEAITRGVGL